MDIIERLNWRYAVKKYNPGKKLAQADLDTILEATRLSASCFGLQPYRVVLVEDHNTRAALSEHSMTNREKIVEASNLLVFAIEQTMDEAYAARYIDQIAEVRGIPREELAGMEKSLKGFVGRFATSEDYQNWARKQAFLALGNMLTVCAVIGVDAGPMEGFAAQKYDEVLGLQGLGLTSAVITTLGYRADDDMAAGLKKVRKPMEEFLVRI